MPKDARFKGRSVANLSEAEAKAALQELLAPEKAEPATRVPPKVRRAGLMPAPGDMGRLRDGPQQNDEVGKESQME